MKHSQSLIILIALNKLRIYLRKGILKGTKVGGGKLWRISEEALKEFIEGGQDISDKEDKADL